MVSCLPTPTPQRSELGESTLRHLTRFEGTVVVGATDIDKSNRWAVAERARFKTARKTGLKWCRFSARGVSNQAPLLTGKPAFLAFAFTLEPLQLPLLEGQRGDMLVVLGAEDHSHDSSSIEASTLKI